MNKKTDLTPDQIKAAEKAGIISKAQANAMRGTSPPKGLASLDDAATIGNEDDMRFVRSFSDVFISIGLGLLVFGLFGVCKLFGGGLMYLGGAALLWFMAEYFGKKKRAHLPTLIIALAYLLFVHTGTGAILSFGNSAVVPALVTLGAMLLFYARFKLPFSIALIAISLLILAFSFLGNIVPFGMFLLLSGLALFVVAIMYDMRDTDRLTRFADNAFWLHFTAAPLIIHGIAVQILSLNQTKIMGILPMVQLDKTDAITLLLIIGVLCVIGLAINRRALIVSSLGYAGFALVMILKGDGFELSSLGSVIAMTLLLLGGGIVFLGVGWHATRRILLKFLPTSGVFGKIFPPVND